jgi:hypothetical protein
MTFYRNFRFVFSIILYVVCTSFHCYYGKDKCLGSLHTETNGIHFKLKNSVTGNDILTAGTSPLPAPDSIKLKDLLTGISYPLYIGLGVNESLIYSQQYQKMANIIDTLEFRFGSSIPDTLIVYTGMIDGWRGDECPTIREPGIIKVNPPEADATRY